MNRNVCNVQWGQGCVYCPMGTGIVFKCPMGTGVCVMYYGDRGD
uniref:Uncharacterized protein n=1 Tax=Anguilla anguilla TaxID=7936 RepID=A0A0E9TRZ1_ANGAN